MPRDFKHFANEHKNILDDDKEKTEEYQEILNKYQNMNSDDLLSNLLNEASKLKSEGKLDSKSISDLQGTLSPFLNDQQKDMLKSIVNAINEQK